LIFLCDLWYRSPRSNALFRINNHGGFGRWAFIEITDPWNAKNEIRTALKEIFR